MQIRLTVPSLLLSIIFSLLLVVISTSSVYAESINNMCYEEMGPLVCDTDGDGHTNCLQSPHSWCEPVYGKVYDPAGNLLNGVTVKVTNMENGSSVTATTGLNESQSSNQDQGVFYAHGGVLAADIGHQTKYKVEVISVPSSYNVGYVRATGFNNNTGTMGWTYNHDSSRDTNSSDTAFIAQRISNNDCNSSAYGTGGRCNFRVNSTPTNTPVPTVPPTAPPATPPATPVPQANGPKITSLSLTNANTGSSASRTGLRTNQGGTSKDNPVKVTVTGEKGTTEIGGIGIGLYGFVGGQSQSSYGNIAALATQHPSQAILLRYFVPEGEEPNLGNFQVYFNGSWITLTTGVQYNVCSTTPGSGVPNPVKNCEEDSNKYRLYGVTAEAVTATSSTITPRWQIEFDKNFGTTTLRSAATVYDNAGIDYFNGNL